ncbi:hypothetical protein C8A01DRAFT_21506, partial [Parachaetomium inaequale]
PTSPSLPIPHDINVVATPGNDTSYAPMAICCAPSTVQIVDRCYLWCDIPKRVLNGINGHPGHWEVEAGMGMYGSEMDNFYILFRSSLMCAHALSKTN